MKRLLLLSLSLVVTLNAVCSDNEEGGIREWVMEKSGKFVVMTAVVGGCILTKRGWHKFGWVTRECFDNQCGKIINRFDNLSQDILQAKSTIIQAVNKLGKDLSSTRRDILDKVTSESKRLSEEIESLQKSGKADSEAINRIEDELSGLHKKLDRLLDIIEKTHKN